MNRRHFLLLTAAALAACGKKAPKHSALPRGSAVLALGDSLTYGYELTGWTVTNGGVSGDTSAQALARLPELLREHTPHLVIISIGGNDFLRRQPENETRTNIRAIIQACKAAGAETLLVGVPGVGVGAALGYPGDHLLYADLAKAENIPYYANGWSQILGKDTLKSDQIHPNAAGYDTFARGLAAYLKESGWLR